MASINRAIFLDADGVLNTAIINQDGNPVAPTCVEDLHIPDEVKPCLLKLKAHGYILCCVTNKPDVARGWMTQAAVDAIMSKMRQELPLDDIYICYLETSDCYKPKPGSLLEGQKKYQLDMSKCYMIGDRWSDIAAGFSAGCKTIWINRHYLHEKAPNPAADFTVSSLTEATEIILG